jgi:triacylglycerol lipase
VHKHLFLGLFYLSMSLGLCGCSEKPIEYEEPIDFSSVDWFALRAHAAYKTEAEIRQLLPNTVRVATLENSDVQYFLERNNESTQQIISIRGTDNLANIKQDADYIPSKNTKLGIYVHKGFDRDTSALYKDLLPHLDKSQSVVLTGHSLGAAISTLLMIYLHEDGFKIAPSVNFGQPKFTSLGGAKKYDFLPLIRVKNQNDIVPNLPPVSVFDSLHGHYAHMGRELILLPGPYYVFRSVSQSEHHSVDSFWRDIGEESVEDHRMVHYVANISPKLESSEQVSMKTLERYDTH